MQSRLLRNSTIFIILLTVQANVAAADPLPTLGMPSNAQAHFDAATNTIRVTWDRPLDADANAALTYEVQKDGVQVYTGTDLQYVDSAPAMAVVYTITAYQGATHGAAAIAVGSPIESTTTYPYCLHIIRFNPLPEIDWSCIFPLPI